MKEISLMINLKVKAFTTTTMAPLIKEIFKTVALMGMESGRTTMAPSSRANLQMVRSERASSSGQTAQSTSAISKTSLSTVTVNTNGLTIAGMKESGRATRCMEKASSLSQMAESTKALTGMTRRTEEACTSGLTEGDLRASSCRVNNTALEFSFLKTVKGEKQSLRMERGLDG